MVEEKPIQNPITSSFLDEILDKPLLKSCTVYPFQIVEIDGRKRIEILFR